MSSNRYRTTTLAAILAAAMCAPLSAQHRSPVAPRDEQLKAVVNEAYNMFKDDRNGKNADYIPYLAKVDSKLFGIAVVTTDNKSYTLGDINYSFSIQSISKVFTLALAMFQHEKCVGISDTVLVYTSSRGAEPLPARMRELLKKNMFKDPEGLA